MLGAKELRANAPFRPEGATRLYAHNGVFVGRPSPGDFSGRVYRNGAKLRAAGRAAAPIVVGQPGRGDQSCSVRSSGSSWRDTRLDRRAAVTRCGG